MKCKGTQITPQQLAEKFHNYYEKFAPFFGYETRKDSRVFDIKSKNARLMIEVCRQILMDVFPEHYDYEEMKEFVKQYEKFNELNPCFKGLE